MIDTYYSTGQLDSPRAFFVALAIGLAFGFVLERAGFGSSRRLAGIFYFRDMTVLRVMFTAVITAMLGLLLFTGMGWIELGSVYAMPTIFGAQVVGGLLFGVGFVMGGWCPGTAAVGAVSGKLDAVAFLGGAIVGSILFNETFPWLGWLMDWGYQEEPLFAFGMPRAVFGLLFTLVAVAAFYFAEWVESLSGGGAYLRSSLLKGLAAALVVAAAALLVLPGDEGAGAVVGGRASEQALLASIDEGADHIEPEDLADRIIAGEPGLVVVDVRPADEYAAFHIRGAINAALSDLPQVLAERKNQGQIVLYSSGMTHPAQARDALARLGYENVWLLTDGLRGFVDRCLTPVSLRSEPLPPEAAARVRRWQAYFTQQQAGARSAASAGAAAREAAETAPAVVSTEWLAERLESASVRILDVRQQPVFSSGHIPGSVRVDPESLRGVVGGVSSMLLPAEMLAEHLGLMGIEPGDTVVLVSGDALRDATLVGMALARVGHRNWSILEGGFARWAAENRPLETALRRLQRHDYHFDPAADWFTVDADQVADALKDSQAVVIDTRPEEYFLGVKSDEARPGHIPGAVNRPYTADLAEDGQFRPIDQLAAEYARLIPAKDTPVIVHCRTGHQASQTWYLLARRLGYENVRWYDGSWTDWAARPDKPVATGKT